MIYKLKNFLKTDAASGIILIITLVFILIVANSSLNRCYQIILHLPGLFFTINDGLMTFFFLSLALEIKYERVAGELVNPKQVLLPVIAALGGVLVPALIYLCFVGTDDPVLRRGWAIPIATDVALTLGLLSLLGKRVPPSLKIFLAVLAIADDLIAIIVIAIFYTTKLSYFYLAFAFIGIAVLLLLNRLNINRLSGYLLVGALIWMALMKSGIHATLAGVAIGFCIPFCNKNQPIISPFLSLKQTLQPWVKFFILPVFVLANAGISILENNNGWLQAMPAGIACGLFLGKQAGIFSIVWLMIKSGLAQLPSDSNWAQLYAVSVLAGTGFTMSLFISNLAFLGTEFARISYVGILAGSTCAAVFGLLILLLVSKKTF